MPEVGKKGERDCKTEAGNDHNQSRAELATKRVSLLDTVQYTIFRTLDLPERNQTCIRDKGW